MGLLRLFTEKPPERFGVKDMLCKHAGPEG